MKINQSLRKTSRQSYPNAKASINKLWYGGNRRKQRTPIVIDALSPWLKSQPIWTKSFALSLRFRSSTRKDYRNCTPSKAKHAHNNHSGKIVQKARRTAIHQKRYQILGPQHGAPLFPILCYISHYQINHKKILYYHFMQLYMIY